MDDSRRNFLKTVGGGALLLAGTDAMASPTHGGGPPVNDDAWGCLVETSLCVGCRKCEAACNENNALPAPETPFEDRSVCETPRRPDDSAFTVVNKYQSEGWNDPAPVFNKFQCMHCNDPACVSACIVGALTKDPRGPVSYDADKCIGCRYCMVACPFQVPAYEYDNALTPRVMKCTYCLDRTSKGQLPACAKICPEEAITFGRRSDLLEIAHMRIEEGPEVHRKRATLLNHVYGEHEVGGTSWLYLSRVPFTEIGLPELPEEAPSRLTEKIQHGIFKFGFLPAALFGVLGATMALFRVKKRVDEEVDE